MTAISVNPFLTENFAPIRQETTAENLPIIGELPPGLTGMYVRNGPNPQFSPLGQYHWFDGDGMLHGIHLQDGRAFYRNRYVQTRGFLSEKEAGRAIWTGLLEPPQLDNPHGPGKNTANTALIWHAGQFLALWEGGEPHALSLPDLDTLGSYTFNGKLAGPVTAHPKIDARTGEMLFFGYNPVHPPYLLYSTVSATGELLRTIPITLPVGVMMHDFAITENYAIFLDLPLTFRGDRLQQGQPALQFERERPSRFGILPRHGDETSIRWFESPSCYVFHTLNAWEAGAEIVLIACRMNGTTILGGSESPADSDVPRLHQWRFNLNTGTVSETPLDDVPGEFPRICEQLTGYPTRYGYVARSAPGELPLFDGIIKYDFHNGTSQTHEYGSGRFGGEAVFVPQPGATAEDDGWLLSLVWDKTTQTSELIVIDAQAMGDRLLARIRLPQRVPYGFHGTWLTQEQCQAR